MHWWPAVDPLRWQWPKHDRPSYLCGRCIDGQCRATFTVVHRLYLTRSGDKTSSAAVIHQIFVRWLGKKPGCCPRGGAECAVFNRGYLRGTEGARRGSFHRNATKPPGSHRKCGENPGGLVAKRVAVVMVATVAVAAAVEIMVLV